ncbi:hypothetical protein, unlikely [Trypanosoma brucei gambiense DAL972]|uniref:Uncharacterized protein n=1 Tax=Trypanosoma brucei gambiense (strain MHOM/CI/86/DAL972) TaxID=679716 RepID=C9ZVQ0_TRYB9|nr:hypothetical protein, unlikely [Trypanosoma brucei gambiense DAL972]CBH13488.1 hypothetical protein, unlikely [Trypanosoma brucei gambiense DAL972]|eukprot:XP_011775765.1 hypothetical protein, unlikely [Trypanosoma brucei gambiense DAL972]
MIMITIIIKIMIASNDNVCKKKKKRTPAQHQYLSIANASFSFPSHNKAKKKRIQGNKFKAPSALSIFPPYPSLLLPLLLTIVICVHPNSVTFSKRGRGNESHKCSASLRSKNK